jgi:AraC family cel operon transcriptional repressor
MDPAIEAYYRIHSTRNNVKHLHTHEYYELHFVTQGNMKHSFEDGHNDIHPSGTLLFIRPEDIHVCLSADETECKYLNLAFPRVTMNELFHYVGNELCTARLLHPIRPPSILLSGQEQQGFLSRFERIATLPSEQSEQIKLELRMLLSDALYRIFQRLEYSTEDSSKPKWLIELYEELHKKEHFIHGTQRMVALSGKSQHHVCREFKKYYKRTPTEFLNELRLNYAASMLACSLQSVLDIALDLNFNNLSHFHHLFKKQFGKSPARYRACMKAAFPD